MYFLHVANDLNGLMFSIYVCDMTKPITPSSNNVFKSYKKKI